MNLSDSERIAAVLENIKYKPAKSMDKANIVVINACSVRQSAIDRIYGVAQKFKKSQKTILTGCVLKKDKKKFDKIFDYILDIKNLSEWPKILGGKNISKNNYLDITPKYSNKFSAYVPIMTGCNNFCSYCVVPYTRGREISRPAKDIIDEVKKIVVTNPPLPKNFGEAREVWLLGQNVNSYKSGKINFPKLLKMVNDIPGDFKLNFTTSHPKDFSAELIETMAKCKKLSMDLNLPIQSGDNEILKKMNRPYTVTQYKNLVKKIRKVLPNIRLSTDVIVGFPGETKKQFNNTVKTLKEVGYGVAFINKYSPRAGTVAAKMEDDVPWAEKKRREKILIQLVNAKNKK